MLTSKFIMRNKINLRLWRPYTQGTSGQGTASSPTQKPTAINANVPGLSNAVVHPASQPVGPGVEPSKSGAYKVPEYFCYDNMSFFEAEIEMSKFRCPQPSALKK